MVKVREDMTGWIMKEHGVPNSRLTVIEQVDDHIKPSGIHIARWRCKCECGNDNVICRGDNLRSGETISCGCYCKEVLADLGRKSKKYNKYDLSGEYGIGWTSNTNREFYFDLEDYDKIKDYCWLEHYKKESYSVLSTYDKNNNKLISMHHLLGMKGHDHVNRNPLDNRKSNLRQVTQRQNNMNKSRRKDNKSGIIGIDFDIRAQKWRAQIGSDLVNKYLGEYIAFDDAVKARLLAELKCFGEFAPQKHLFEQYGIKGGDDLNG